MFIWLGDYLFLSLFCMSLFWVPHPAGKQKESPTGCRVLLQPRLIAVAIYISSHWGHLDQLNFILSCRRRRS